MTRAGFAYAHARMQSRLADRMKDAEWRLLENSRNFEHCLEMLRRFSTSGIGQKLAHQTDIHAVEKLMGDSFVDQAQVVIAWLPEAWQPAARWFATLPFLRDLGNDRSPARTPITLAGIPDIAAPMLSPTNGRADWLRIWEKQMPGRNEAATLRAALDPVLNRYLGPDGHAGTRGDDDRAPLETALMKTFRKHAQTPIAAFAFLGILMLDHEHLRGVLVTGLLFPESA